MMAYANQMQAAQKGKPRLALLVAPEVLQAPDGFLSRLPVCRAIKAKDSSALCAHGHLMKEHKIKRRHINMYINIKLIALKGHTPGGEVFPA
jgi:hypothetical protein